MAIALESGEVTLPNQSDPGGTIDAGRTINKAREASTRGPHSGNRDRAEPLAKPTRHIPRN